MSLENGKRLGGLLIALALASVIIISLGSAVASGPGPLRAVGAVANDAPEGERCLSRIAIETELGVFCSAVCKKDVECPEGWGCRKTHQGGAPPIGLCTPRRHVPESSTSAPR